VHARSRRRQRSSGAPATSDASAAQQHQADGNGQRGHGADGDGGPAGGALGPGRGRPAQLPCSESARHPLHGAGERRRGAVEREGHRPLLHGRGQRPGQDGRRRYGRRGSAAAVRASCRSCCCRPGRSGRRGCQRAPAARGRAGRRTRTRWRCWPGPRRRRSAGTARRHADGCSRGSNSAQVDSALTCTNRGVLRPPRTPGGTGAPPSGLPVVYQSGLARLACTPPELSRRNASPPRARTSIGTGVLLVRTSSSTTLGRTSTPTPTGRAGCTPSSTVRTAGSPRPWACAGAAPGSVRTAASPGAGWPGSGRGGRGAAVPAHPAAPRTLARTRHGPAERSTLATW